MVANPSNFFPISRGLNPLGDQAWQTINDFTAKENFVNVSHVEHVDDPAQVRSPAIPPSESVIQDEVMLHVYALGMAQLFKFKSIQQSFIDPIRNTAAKGCRVVVFFDLPNSDWVYGGRKSAINTPGKRSERHSVCRDAGKPVRIKLAVELGTVSVNNHAHHACQERGLFLCALLLVHRNERSGFQRSPKFSEKFSCLAYVHQKRSHRVVDRLRPERKVISQFQAKLSQIPSGIEDMLGGKLKFHECVFDLIFRRDEDAAGRPVCVADLLADRANVGPKMFGQSLKAAVWLHETSFSNRRTKSPKEIPNALQICLNSTRSSLRSPDSYLLTNDCGCSTRSATSAWVKPDSERTDRSSAASFSLSVLLKLLPIWSRLTRSRPKSQIGILRLPSRPNWR